MHDLLGEVAEGVLGPLFRLTNSSSPGDDYCTKVRL